MMGAGGLCMMVPGAMTDLIGLALLGVICAFQYMGREPAVA